ncbi:MAG: NH(3)-dependent NAD(+) synthetase [Planctomycetes bacterium]|nr:NH(3)-dependent NAD(+) synthetase [Planctomycetota bacterium]
MGPDALPRLDAALAERVLVRFLRDESARVGMSKLVLGLSGGIDSAVAAFLAARAVGAENVVAINMPAAESSPESRADAELVAAACGIALDVVPIAEGAAGLLARIGDATPLRRGNVYARLRMIVLYDRSAAVSGLVVGTSNKTELLLGYGTMFGDLASAMNPLGDLWKCQVRALARHLGVPDRVIAKAPSADLWSGQTDEGDFGFTYDLADAILSRLADRRMPPESVVAEGFPEPVVRRIARMIVRSQFKRRPPLIAKLSQRTVGWEFRYPRDWGT